MTQRSGALRPAAGAPSRRPVPVGELLGAWHAVMRGDFRRSTTRPAATTRIPDSPATVWQPADGEIPVLVVGCGGSCGASTVALLLAEAAGRARVVECAPGSCSGLAGASEAELGEVAGGWVQGSRGDVLIQRRSDPLVAVAAVPAPPPVTGDAGLTVVDCWWEFGQALASSGWLGDLARACPRVTLVARGSVPGLRRLETCLAMAGGDRCRVVVTGVSERRWPRHVEASMGPLARQRRASGHLYCLPDHPGLSLSGLTPAPLPKSFDPTASLLLKGLLP